MTNPLVGHMISSQGHVLVDHMMSKVSRSYVMRHVIGHMIRHMTDHVVVSQGHVVEIYLYHMTVTWFRGGFGRTLF